MPPNVDMDVSDVVVTVNGPPTEAVPIIVVFPPLYIFFETAAPPRDTRAPIPSPVASVVAVTRTNAEFVNPPEDDNVPPIKIDPPTASPPPNVREPPEVADVASVVLLMERPPFARTSVPTVEEVELVVPYKVTTPVPANLAVSVAPA